MRGAHRRRSCKAEQGVASPERFATARGRTTPSTPGGTTPRAAIAAWSREERQQNAGPGPKTSRWSAEKRGVGSLRRRALASKVRARVRSCTHSGCTQHPGAYRRSARPSRGGEKKKEERRGNEERCSGQRFIPLSSPRKRGPITPGRSRGPCSWVPAFAVTTRRVIHAGLFDIVKREKRAIPRRRSCAGPRRSA